MMASQAASCQSRPPPPPPSSATAMIIDSQDVKLSCKPRVALVQISDRQMYGIARTDVLSSSNISLKTCCNITHEEKSQHNMHDINLKDHVNYDDENNVIPIMENSTNLSANENFSVDSKCLDRCSKFKGNVKNVQNSIKVTSNHSNLNSSPDTFSLGSRKSDLASTLMIQNNNNNNDDSNNSSSLVKLNETNASKSEQIDGFSMESECLVAVSSVAVGQTYASLEDPEEKEVLEMNLELTDSDSEPEESQQSNGLQLLCMESLPQSEDEADICDDINVPESPSDRLVDNLCLDENSSTSVKTMNVNSNDKFSQSDYSNDSLYIACDEDAPVAAQTEDEKEHETMLWEDNDADQPQCLESCQNMYSSCSPIQSESDNKMETEKESESVPSVTENSSNVDAMVALKSKSPKYYHFKLNNAKVIQNKHRKSFQCDICSVNYRHMYSLRRHYLKTHINSKYISEQDLVHFSINSNEVGNDKVGGAYSKPNSKLPVATKSEDVLPANELSGNAQHKVPDSAAVAEKDENDNTTNQRSEEIHILVNVDGSTIECKVTDTAEVKEGDGDDQPTMVGLYKCNLCPKMFDRREELCTHLAKHPGTTSQQGGFECRHCNLFFSLKRYLMRHMIVHVGQRKSKKKDSVKTASLTQENSSNKPDEVIFSCSQCSKIFLTSDELKQHVESHDKLTFIEADKAKSLSRGSNSTGNRYGCTLCKKVFSNYINMCRHRRLAHHVSQRMNGRIRVFHSPFYSLNQRQTFKKPFMNQDLGDDKVDDNFDPNFYTELAESVKENLMHYVDGKANHINMKTLDEVNDDLKGQIEDIDFVSVNLPEIKSQNMMHINYKDDSTRVKNDNLDNREIKKEVEEELSELSINSYQNMIEAAHLLLEKCKNHNCDRNESKNGDGHGNITECQRNDKSEKSLFVCYSCNDTFFKLDELMDHKLQEHPTIYSTHLELIGETECPPELRIKHTESFGLLNQCTTGDEISADSDSLRCTKCNSEFSCTTLLHSHILDCGEDKSLISNVTSSFFKPPGHRRQKGMKRKIRDEPAISVTQKSSAIEEPVDKTKFAIKYNLGLKTATPKDVPEVLASAEPSKATPTGRELRCEGCYMKFDYIAALERHQRACTMARRLNGIKSSARGLYSRHNLSSNKRQCEYCLCSFSYLASLRKHMEEGCVQQDIGAERKKAMVRREKGFQRKKQAADNTDSSSTQPVNKLEPSVSGKESNDNGKTTSTGVKKGQKLVAVIEEQCQCSSCNQWFSGNGPYEKHVNEGCTGSNVSSKIDELENSVHNQIEQSMIGLLNTQSEQNKILGDVKKSPNKSKLQSFACNICHTIYFSYVKLLKHRLSHKLEKSDSEKTTLEIEKQDKFQGGSKPKDEQKPNGHDESSGNKSSSSLTVVVECSGYKEEDCTCPTCGRLFASPLNLGRHKRMAHGIIREALNKRRMILSQQTDEEKAKGSAFRVCVSKVEYDGEGETKFIIQPKEPKQDSGAPAKKRGRKSKAQSSIDEVTEKFEPEEASPKKRGWPKGRKRKGWLRKVVTTDKETV